MRPGHAVGDMMAVSNLPAAALAEAKPDYRSARAFRHGLEDIAAELGRRIGEG
jgi:hypothetical protein